MSQKSIVQGESDDEIAARRTARTVAKAAKLAGTPTEGAAPEEEVVERIAPDDMAELLRLRQNIQSAERQLAEAQEIFTSAKAIYDYIFHRTRQRYGLGESDAFANTGEIVRG